MTDLGYMVWLVGTAIMTLTVLTVGTLAAAGLLERDRRDRRATPQPGPKDALRPLERSAQPVPARRQHDHAA